jgi:hypothetical protein
MKQIMLFSLLAITSHAATPAVAAYPQVVLVTTNPIPVTLGDLATAQNYFLMGLEYGSGLAALLLGFISVRRALSMGDAWND